MNLDPSSIGKFVALGGTFTSHQEEKERSYRWPDLWIVPSEGVVPAGHPIQIPNRVEDVKPGAELTAVIGDDIWQATDDEAWDAIKGFTVSNDVTATGEWPLISDPKHGGTGVGYKLFPTFSPILSEYKPKRKIDAYRDLEISVKIDGEVAARGSTSQLDFSIPEMISFSSNIVELKENDVVALGDPGNCDKFIDNASQVTCSIESIGKLTNPIR